MIETRENDIKNNWGTRAYVFEVLAKPFPLANPSLSPR